MTSNDIIFSSELKDNELTQYTKNGFSIQHSSVMTKLEQKYIDYVSTHSLHYYNKYMKRKLSLIFSCFLKGIRQHSFTPCNNTDITFFIQDEVQNAHNLIVTNDKDNKYSKLMLRKLNYIYDFHTTYIQSHDINIGNQPLSEFIRQENYFISVMKNSSNSFLEQYLIKKYELIDTLKFVYPSTSLNKYISEYITNTSIKQEEELLTHLKNKSNYRYERCIKVKSNLYNSIEIKNESDKQNTTNNNFDNKDRTTNDFDNEDTTNSNVDNGDSFNKYNELSTNNSSNEDTTNSNIDNRNNINKCNELSTNIDPDLAPVINFINNFNTCLVQKSDMISIRDFDNIFFMKQMEYAHECNMKLLELKLATIELEKQKLLHSK